MGSKASASPAEPSATEWSRIRFAPRLGFLTCPMELEPICASGDFDSKACANSPETSPETLDEQAVKETGINNTALQQTNHTNSSRGLLS